MTSASLEQLVIDAFHDARVTIAPSEDLFARVQLSLDARAERSRFRRRVGVIVATFVVISAGFAFSLADYNNGRITMKWWVVELVTNAALVALAVGLGPFIKRFGRSYAADVFRASPRTGKSYLVLTDVAYYLIFTSFVLFTVTFVQPYSWEGQLGVQLKHEVARIGGILLIMGALHVANVAFLPVVGQLLDGSRRASPARLTGSGSGEPAAGLPPLGPGTWLLRIEPAPAAPAGSAAAGEPSSGSGEETTSS